MRLSKRDGNRCLPPLPSGFRPLTFATSVSLFSIIASRWLLLLLPSMVSCCILRPLHHPPPTFAIACCAIINLFITSHRPFLPLIRWDTILLLLAVSPLLTPLPSSWLILMFPNGDHPHPTAIPALKETKVHASVTNDVRSQMPTRGRLQKGVSINIFLAEGVFP